MQRLSQTDTSTDTGATALQALRYTYNSVGLIDRIQNLITPGPMRGSSEHNFTYDEHEQLVSATGSFRHESGDERRYSLSMSYDSIGRTTKMKQTDELLGAGGGVTTITETTRSSTYTYAGPRVHAASQVGGDEYWYDNNGNQAWRYNASSGDWRALSWDDEDRLVGAFVPGTSEYFNYDAGGARTHKTDYTETTLYPSAFVTIRIGGEVTKHIWAGGERVGSVVRPEGGGVTDERAYWTHNDHLGGGHYVTTSVGAVYEMAERLPFGENWVSARAGTDRVAPGFAGSEHDEHIGLNYHGARYYDAKEARWTGRDPALEEYMAGGGVFDPRNLGLYNYAFNSPVSYWDPDGRQSVPAGPGTDASGQPDPIPRAPSEQPLPDPSPTVPFVLTQNGRPTSEPGLLVIGRVDHDVYSLPAEAMRDLESRIENERIQMIRSLEQSRQNRGRRSVGDVAVRVLTEVATGVASGFASGFRNLFTGGFGVGTDNYVPSAPERVLRVGVGVIEIYANAAIVGSVLRGARRMLTDASLIAGEEGSIGLPRPGLPNPGAATGWRMGPRDIDWRGTGTSTRAALDEAFRRTGVARSEFEVTRWARDVNGKSWPVEWRVPARTRANTPNPNRGAEVSMDSAHTVDGPSVPHLGYQTPGSRRSGGAVRGHILLDDVPANR
jgi:RHS repeat-associated protein